MARSTHVGHLIKLAALALFVHRYWPKGIIYSDSEKHASPQRHRGRSRSRARRHHGSSSYGGSDRGGERDRRELYHEDTKSELAGRRRRRSEAYYRDDPPRYDAKGSYFYDT